MSDNIKLVDFQKNKKSEANASVVALLSDYLAMAKAGRVTGVALACLTNDGCTITAISIAPQQTPMLLLGACAHLAHRINLTLDETPGAPIEKEPAADETDPVRIEITENGAPTNGTPED